jgi:hypothetical protein
MYGSSMNINYYHQTYEPPFCYQVAKELFDKYK